MGVRYDETPVGSKISQIAYWSFAASPLYVGSLAGRANSCSTRNAIASYFCPEFTWLAKRAPVGLAIVPDGETAPHDSPSITSSEKSSQITGVFTTVLTVA